MRFTLDTNCIIEVEDKRQFAATVSELVSLHGKNGINIAVSAIGASERQRTGGYAKTFSEFQAKLAAVGFDAVELLRPRGYFDLTYYGYSDWADKNDTLEQQIHQAMFPNIEFLWKDYANAHGLPVDKPDKRWRNPKCDVLALWCHIKYGGDIFVTIDDDFHKKQKELVALGAGEIALPDKALKRAKALAE